MINRVGTTTTNDSARILVVDDAADTRLMLSLRLQREGYAILPAGSGQEAIEIVNREGLPDLAVLDIMMPGMDGYEVCRQLKTDPATSDIPIIFVTARTEVADETLGFELGAVDYITKPISPPIVRARVHTHLTLHDQRRAMAWEVRERTRELKETRLEIIRHLARAAEFKDKDTGAHIIRMSHYSRLLGQAYGGNEEWLDYLFNAAPMHDVGKIGIPDSILLKPGKLDPKEWEEMKRHTSYGGDIIGESSSPLLRMARDIALSHHEHWDGSGYPLGLKARDIPLEGRIVAIADVFDALTSQRPYKQAWTVANAFEEIRAGAGTHFDPTLVALFERILPECLEVRAQYDDPGN